MPILQIVPKRKQSACFINSDGRLILSAPTLDRLKWHHGEAISLSYLSDPLTLLLRQVDDENGFKLVRRASSTRTSPRGVITCTGFTNRVLRARIALPRKNITPIILKNSSFQIALMLETPKWIQEEFSQSGRQNVPPDVKGVYQLLGATGDTLRVGEGVINNRMGQHLKNSQYLEAVRLFRYCALSDKEEMEMFEQVLLASYEAATGNLPVLNTLRG